MYATNLTLRLAQQHSTRSPIRNGNIYSITDNLNYLRARAEHRITRWTVARPPVVYSPSKAPRYLFVFTVLDAVYTWGSHLLFRPLFSRFVTN